MKNEDYELTIKLINDNMDIVTLGEFGQGVSDLWINKAQERLNVTFPPSYIWWLKNYGGGEILGEEIFSVYEKDFDTVVGGDIVYINELNKKNGVSKDTQLVIQKTDNAEIFYLDLRQMDENGEYPIYRKFASTNTKYADDFLGFLKRRIIDEY
ncbi:MAG TPA: SMI1/KNR4 family protein [Mucilaginibacter sp.]|nr:SMI1/KNR4 family protein [Mucilaginibacter sp.]